MLENLQLCARAEYDDNYRNRRQASELTSGEALMAYFRVEEDDSLAIKLPLVIGQVSLRASGLHEVRALFINPDMQPYADVAGIHRDGIWNGVNEKPRGGGVKFISIVYDMVSDKLHGTDAVFGDYEDDIDRELSAIIDKELVRVGPSV